jgi:hypothetical protein
MHRPRSTSAAIKDECPGPAGAAIVADLAPGSRSYDPLAITVEVRDQPLLGLLHRLVAYANGDNAGGMNQRVESKTTKTRATIQQSTRIVQNDALPRGLSDVRVIGLNVFIPT